MINNPEDNQVMTVRQVAAFLQFSETKVYRMLNKGEIPGMKFGGQWRVLRSALEEYMLRRVISRPPEPVAQTGAYVSLDG